jgi:hypothetical protein
VRSRHEVGYSDAVTKKRLRQLASLFVLVVAVLFIIISMSQIIAAVFGAAPPRVAATPEESACTEKLRTLEAALSRASDRAAHEPDDAHARSVFEAAIAPEWDDEAAAEKTCSPTARSREAWAALLRLRRGYEGRSQKDARDVGPMRRDFETRLP